jgi:hypothetical protein
MRALLLAGGLLALLAGCHDGKSLLRAKQIERHDELIGGPSAKGKLGDYLIENDRVRAIVGGLGQGWAGGVFGGSLLDVDRRRWQSELRDGNGWDNFSETFPLANLLVSNPDDPTRALLLGPDSIQVKADARAVTVVKDGSDGEAIIRVSGHGGYMFEVMKYLNRGVLEGLLGSLNLGGLDKNKIIDLAKALLGVNLYSVLNRLELNFDFVTEYVLHDGESYLTIRTTIKLAPPAPDMLAGCPPVVCDKQPGDCPNGFVMDELDEAVEGMKVHFKRQCPASPCQCAEARPAMATLNESRDIFSIMLGDLAHWTDPTWKGGVLAGDFLFFGSEADIFAPGIGFDENRKIFENMWQGVGTLASPLTFDWVAAVAKNVSYGWVTRNPEEKAGVDCPGYRVAILGVDPAREEALAQALIDELGFAEGAARGKVRQAIVDRKPIPLADVPMDATVPEGATQGEKDAIFATWQAGVMAGDTVKQYRDTLGEGATLGLIAAHDCMPSKVLIPLFTTSATAVLTHFVGDDRLQEIEKDKHYRDTTRAYTFERYLLVGDGDVGSVLDSAYSLRGTPVGRVRGVVLEQQSLAPLSGVNVLVVRDWREDPTKEAVPAGYQEYREKAMELWGDNGFVSQMETDVGLVPRPDGSFKGPLPPGRYFVFAHTQGRGTSAFAAITVAQGQTEVVNLTLPLEGHVEYRVEDQGGQGIPARLSFLALDAGNQQLNWDGRNEADLQDPRYDYGIAVMDQTTDGRGLVTVPPGRYDVYVSRGFEYGLHVERGFQVKAGQTVTLQAVVPRQLDTRGRIAGDFHIHQMPSVDSSLPLTERVIAGAAEGLELITATDHDSITDYSPYIKQLDLERFLASQIGVETTTLEFGHYNAFPLKYDARDWGVHNPPPWYGKPLAEVFAAMRERASSDAVTVQVNHPRDGFMGLFSQMGLDGVSLERKTGGMEVCNPATEAIPCDFDAIELMNEKRFELLRTPTVGEMDLHNRCYDAIMQARTTKEFMLGTPEDAICGLLRQDPADGCDGADEAARAEGLDDAQREAALRFRDHCHWHLEFRVAMSHCGDEGISLIACKRWAFEGLKMLSVRYMMERTPEEQAAFFASVTSDDPALNNDPGCDMTRAMAGCTELLDGGGVPQAGCGEAEDCPVGACVCAAHPECCQELADGGTGWTEDCATAAVAECHGCGVQPCTDRYQIIDDWFGFLNAGFNVTGVSNSDSHDLENEIGLPRNFVASGADQPHAISADDVDRAVKQHQVVMSSGPYIDFLVEEVKGGAVLQAGDIGDTLALAEGSEVQARIKVQTPDWFGVDRVEVYRNGALEHVLRPEVPASEVVDLDTLVKLGRPAQDSWYVVIAYGLNDGHQLSPVYKRVPYGKILLPTIISLGAAQLLASFEDVLKKLPAGILDLSSLTESSELPDSFPIFPFAITNPVWVDADGGGFLAKNAVKGADGQVKLPPFCSQPCVPAPDDQGQPTQATCGANQTCVPTAEGQGQCRIPVPSYCAGAAPMTETAGGAIGGAPGSLPAGMIKRLFDSHRH